MSKKNICILGGTGYLGELLVRKLLLEEYKVTVLHRDKSNIENLKSIENTNLVLRNINTEEISFKLIDCVVNLACVYDRFDATIEEIVDGNFIYPMKILTLALESNVSEFLSINTSLPDMFNMYSLSKKQFVEWGKYLAEHSNIQFTNVILENYYGENEPDNRFLPSVIRKMKCNEDVLLTEGTQRRDFIHVDDVINILVCIIKKEDKSAYYEVPVGTGDAPTVKEVIEYLCITLNSKSNLLFGAIPSRKNEPSCVADISEIKKLGYDIKYNWKSGLSKIC